MYTISSPDTKLISTFANSLEKIEIANIGDMSFSIKGVKIIKSRIGRTANIVTRTPIINRIPKENYEKYGIKPPKDYDYLYWRKNYSFNAFIKQLEDNLFKKYNDFFNASLELFPIFEQFIFKKQVCNHIIIGGREVKVFGSLWEFIFNYLSKEQQKVLQFGLDAGFGELNSLGFGFMNLKK